MSVNGSLGVFGEKLEKGLVAIAKALESRGATYNIIVNVPVGADQDEISRKVVAALEHADRTKQAQHRSSRI